MLSQSVKMVKKIIHLYVRNEVNPAVQRPTERSLDYEIKAELYHNNNK